MIRTTHEAALLGLWRDRTLLTEIAQPAYLTTGRYEPILRRHFGGGHVDLVFERAGQCVLVGALRLQAANLVTREQSPFIWPAHLAALLAQERMIEIERRVLPWLRSLALARPMATESIRRFAPSAFFDRARAAGFLGAAPLERSLVILAPFVYARRFARGAHIELACSQAALGQAVLGDLAASIRVSGDERGEDEFGQTWYGVQPATRSTAPPDLAIVDQPRAARATVIITTVAEAAPSAQRIPIPSPAPWDLLFSFDDSDAPPAAAFAVSAPQPPLRAPVVLAPPTLSGVLVGSIVLGLSAEALARRGPDVEEIEIFAAWLHAEGLHVEVTAQADDPAISKAALVHIFGAPYEAHTSAFATAAFERGVAYVFDLPPQPAQISPLRENLLVALYRAAAVQAELEAYLQAYERETLDAAGACEVNVVDHQSHTAAFNQRAAGALAILCSPEDVSGHRAALPYVAERIVARGVFAQSEPAAAPIGHLVPSQPFALLDGPLAARTHSLFPALAAERAQIPLVIAGPVYDADYLQLVRAHAPSAVVIADPTAGMMGALYRAAAVFVEAAPRPCSAAALLRAVACGVLPAIAVESPLARIVAGAPLFSLGSIDSCAQTLQSAFDPGRRARMAALAQRLAPRRDPATVLKSVLAAYARAVEPVAR